MDNVFTPKNSITKCFCILAFVLVLASTFVPARASVIEDELMSSTGSYTSSGDANVWLFQIDQLPLGNEFVVEFTASTFTKDRLNVAFSEMPITYGITTTNGYAFFLRANSGGIGMYNGSVERAYALTNPGGTSPAQGTELNVSLVFNTGDNLVTYYVNDALLGSFSPDSDWSLSDSERFIPNYLGLSAYNGSSTFSNVVVGLLAESFESAQTGSWATPGTWVGDEVPSAEASALTVEDHVVTVDTVNTAVGSLALYGTSTLRVTQGADLAVTHSVRSPENATLDVAGTLTAAGFIFGDESSANVSGSLASTGNATFGTLNASGNANLSVGGTATIDTFNVSGSANFSAAGGASIASLALADGATLANYGAGKTVVSSITSGANSVLANSGSLQIDSRDLPSLIKLNGGSVALKGGAEVGLNQTWTAAGTNYDGYNNTSTMTAEATGVIGCVADGTVSTIFQTFGYTVDNTKATTINTVLNDSTGYANNYARILTGYFVPDSDTVTIWTRADDTTSVWIDMNQNGVFDDNERIVKSHWDDGGASATVTTFSPGEFYAMAFIFTEITGGDIMQLQMGTGTQSYSTSTNNFVFADSVDYGGTFYTSDIVGAIDYSSTDLEASADSTVSLSASSGVSFGDMKFTKSSKVTFDRASAVSLGTISLAATGAPLAAGVESDSLSIRDALDMRSNSIDTFSVSGALSFEDTSKLFLDVNGVNMDSLVAGGAISFGEDIVINLTNTGTDAILEDTMYLLALSDTNEYAGWQTLAFEDGVTGVLRVLDDGLYITNLSFGDGNEVPEPGTFALLVLGALGIVGVARRRIFGVKKSV
ncbi:MAG: PEP-CTERM sorting domain-containing protein [Planctomycetia bacterium]|nr:PEP-CTERM sorting domain-containing protein [Planctomycetia bacterium]